MGYSLAVPCKSPKARAQVLAFFEEHYRPWHKLAEGTDLACHPDYDPTWEVLPGESLSYDKGPLKVGFNFTSQGEHGQYMWGILRWVALRMGRVRTFKKYGIPTRVPYVVYDGYQAHPTLLRSVWLGRVVDDDQQFLVDQHGFTTTLRWWDLVVSEAQPEQSVKDYYETKFGLRDALVHAELKRLSELWVAHRTP